MKKHDCFTVKPCEDALTVAANAVGVEADIEGLIKTRRCFDMPVGTSVEVVERMKLPGGGEANAVCVKLAGMSGSACVWLLIQRLDVRAV